MFMFPGFFASGLVRRPMTALAPGIAVPNGATIAILQLAHAPGKFYTLMNREQQGNRMQTQIHICTRDMHLYYI